MTTTSTRRTRPLSRWLLVALHVVVVAVPVAYTVFPLFEDVSVVNWLLPVGLGAVMGGLLLRHSLAAVAGRRPAGWPWTLSALALLAFVPGPLWGWENWSFTAGTWPFMASALMLLPRWAGVGCFAATLAVNTTASLVIVSGVEALSVGDFAFWVGYRVCGALTPAALYGAVRLVRMADELQATRAELAEVAVGRERLRVARDLHDLLGHSLSAVSLKGDLALRLLNRDLPAARAEVEGMAELARDSLQQMSSIARNEHPVSLATELDGAAGLLRAAGVAVRTDIRLPDLQPGVQEALAWAVREGVTNVIRHSGARTATITAGAEDGRIRLELVNDRAGTGDTGYGNGLAGIAERASAAGGSAAAGPLPGGRFRLAVDVPHGGEKLSDEENA